MYLNEMLLTLDETSYDSVVNTILADPRLIKGLRKKGSLKPRKHILKKLNAKDLFTWMGSIGSSFAIDRGLLKRKAAVNQAKIIN